MQEHPGQSYVQANIQPPNPNSVNWNAAPSPFKLYRNCEQIRCTYEPSGLSGALAENDVENALLGQMLWDIYGLTRQCHTIKEESPMHHYAFPQQLDRKEEQDQEFYMSLLRPVPSGGALFPCELYVLVGPGKSFPMGVYHYDAAHHALDIIRQGDYSHLLHAYLAHPGNTPPAYTFLLSCCFWKDGFKYGAFSYRLQGFDIGAVIAQSEIVIGHSDLEATIHYQFLDTAVDDLIGLDPLRESIYAIVTLSPTHQLALNGADVYLSKTLKESVSLQPTPLAEPLESIAHWPLPEAVHRASCIETRAVFSSLRSLSSIKRLESNASRSLLASDTSLDLWEARYERHSASGFVQAPLTEQQLAQLLLVSTRGSTNDIDGRSEFLRHTLLYCVVNRVQNIPAGIYCYHPEKHVLEIIHVGEVQNRFQELLGWPNLNLFHMNVCLIPVANYKHGFQVYDDRWYRMQNMEAGIITQRLYLATAALKLGCRANLGYDVPKMDTLLCLPEEYTSLLQILIAPERLPHQHYAQSLRI